MDNEAGEVAAAQYPLIREFRVRLNMKDEPRQDVEAAWSVCSPGTVGRFSATAYFFARELFRKFQVPVGLVVSTFGASTAQAWTSRPALSARPEFGFMLKAYEEACVKYDTGNVARRKFLDDFEQWKKAADQARAEGKPAGRPPRNMNPHQDQHNPSVLYNGMIAPLVPYAVRGAIWYQGESNYPTGKIYYELMETLIDDWRARWNQNDFPFLFVQLAGNKKPAVDPNEKSEMAPVREGQLQTLRIEGTGMAVAIDIGDAANIHPKNKQEIGRRLGLAARALVYGEKLPYSGPIFERAKFRKNEARISFKHAEGGLAAKGDTLRGFAVAGADSVFYWADAKIEGRAVVASNPSVPRPVALRYGWADNPPANLVNGAGLPASPFRTDGW